jgi:hypothetical protein
VEELLCEEVVFEDTNYPCTIFLPEVCKLPIGIHWPADVGFNDYYLSMQGAMDLAGQVFQQMLKGMEKIL